MMAILRSWEVDTQGTGGRAKPRIVEARRGLRPPPPHYLYKSSRLTPGYALPGGRFPTPGPPRPTRSGLQKRQPPPARRRCIGLVQRPGALIAADFDGFAAHRHLDADAFDPAIARRTGLLVHDLTLLAQPGRILGQCDRAALSQSLAKESDSRRHGQMLSYRWAVRRDRAVASAGRFVFEPGIASHRSVLRQRQAHRAGCHVVGRTGAGLDVGLRNVCSTSSRRRCRGASTTAPLFEQRFLEPRLTAEYRSLERSAS